MDEHQIYTKFCRPRFEAVEKHQAQIAEDVSAIRGKVFNGYGEAIKDVREDMNDLRKWMHEELKSLRGWLMGLIGTVALTVIVSMVKLIWF